MAEKKKYNSILVSGRKDETLTYSKYVKDEESGESVKESLDKKVNVTDELTTQQIKDGAITNEKMAADSVGNTNLQDGSVSNEKLEDGSITNEKLAENSITKDKLKDNTIGVEKLDPELRQTINAATGLPENLVETIQNVDDTLKDHQRQLDDKQSQIDDKQQQITANDEDISLLQTRSTQMEETIESIAATGGASQATAVTYNNEKSKLTAVNIQSAVDEVVDKTAIKDEEGTVVETPFRYIQNEEFIKAIVDSDDKVLFGFYRATGKPYFPLSEMYHVEQNEEFFAVWLDAANHVLLGIRRDGEIIGEIHAVNALKQVVSQLQSDLASLQEKLGTIDANLKELLDVFSLQDNEEYLAVEQDSEGKVLSATHPDGSHYIYNAKSETIPTEFSHIEDPEGRTEITTDAEDKILGYRDSEGTRHEHKISAKHLELSSEAAKEVNDAFKSAGIKMENPSDFSKESHIELPIPRIAAQVRIYAPKLPATKTDDIEAEIEYNDKDGNYFRKPVILNAQGSSSMCYYVKNMAIDLNDASEIKFGDFPTQDSFHLKKYYIDAFRGQCIVGYWLMEQVYKSRSIGQQYPYESNYSNDSVVNGLGDIKKDFFTGAKCHPDGFPIVITWINSDTGKETWMGVYAWNLKKSKEVYQCDKKKAENIILDGLIDDTTLFNGTVDWSQFEIRNPKSLIDINGDKYDGENPKELSDTDELSSKVKQYIKRLSSAAAELGKSNTKETFEKFFIPAPYIDYELVSEILYNIDGYHRNWIWVLYNGLRTMPTLYDVDSIFGSQTKGMYIYKDSTTNILGSKGFPTDHLLSLYKTEVEKRYKELRDNKIFSVQNIVSLLAKWCNSVGYDNYKKEFEVYNETPSHRDAFVNDGWEIISYTDDLSINTYVEDKTYNEGDTCTLGGCTLQATKTMQGVIPLSHLYTNNPTGGGYYNSIQRVSNWLTERIKTLDTYFNYNK